MPDDAPKKQSARGFANPNHPMYRPPSGIPAYGNTGDSPPSGIPAHGLHTPFSATNQPPPGASQIGRLTAAEMREMALERARRAMEVIDEEMALDPGHPARLRAAELVLDRGYGKVNQPLSVTTDEMTPAERDARIEYLLARRREREGLAAATIAGALPAPTIGAGGTAADGTTSDAATPDTGPGATLRPGK